MAVTPTDEEAQYARELASLRTTAPLPDTSSSENAAADEGDTEADDESTETFDPAVAARQLGRAQAAATEANREAEDNQAEAAPEDQSPALTGGAGSFLQRQLMRRFVSKALGTSLRAAIFAFLEFIAPFLLYFTLILVFILMVIFIYFLVTCETPFVQLFTCQE